MGTRQTGSERRVRLERVLTVFMGAWGLSIAAYLLFNVLAFAQVGTSSATRWNAPLLTAGAFYLFASAANLFNAWFLKLYWRQLSPGTARRTPFDVVVCSLVPVLNAFFWRQVWREGLEAGLKSLAERGVDRHDLAPPAWLTRACGVCAGAVWASFAVGAAFGLALFGLETCLWVVVVLPFAFIGAPVYSVRAAEDLLTNGLTPHLPAGNSGVLLVGAAIAYLGWVLSSAAWQPLRIILLRRMAAIAAELDAAAPKKTGKK